MSGKRFGPPVVMGDESIMSPKAHGTSAVWVARNHHSECFPFLDFVEIHLSSPSSLFIYIFSPVQDTLRWECDHKTADNICNFNVRQTNTLEVAMAWFDGLTWCLLTSTVVMCFSSLLAAVRLTSVTASIWLCVKNIWQCWGFSSIRLYFSWQDCFVPFASSLCSHYAEFSGYFEGKTKFLQEAKNSTRPIEFYDSNSGKLLFTAPIGRTMDDFLIESKGNERVAVDRMLLMMDGWEQLTASFLCLLSFFFQLTAGHPSVTRKSIGITSESCRTARRSLWTALTWDTIFQVRTVDSLPPSGTFCVLNLADQVCFHWFITLLSGNCRQERQQILHQ